MSNPITESQENLARQTDASQFFSSVARAAKAMGGSLTMRVTFVAGLVLAMLIPVLFLNVTVNERGGRYQSMLYDIASSWGHDQLIQGPVLRVPYTKKVRYSETITLNNGVERLVEKTRMEQLELLVLPTSLKMHVELGTETRKRGIYESLVYLADVNISADYAALNMDALPREVQAIHWDLATIAFGLSDTRAVDNVKSVSWNDEPQTLNPGHSVSQLDSGFNMRLKEFDPFKPHTLKMALSVRGSGSFSFAPLGETTEVSIESSWPHPSFNGRVLPVQREIKPDGFTAKYVIPHLARTYPQIWTSESGGIRLTELTAGVRLFEPVSLYTKIERSVKYGILFIGLTFLLMLVFEQAVGMRMHAVQYLLVGCALALFYLILLSLSEHIAFLLAYLVSAVSIIAIISSYVGVVLRSPLRGSQMFFLMSFLYLMLYSLLQLEDYALLLGTALLVSVLVAMMMVTKNLARRTIGSDAI